MTSKHNEQFNLDVYASNSEAARTSDTVADFRSQFIGSQAEPINFTREQDNDIYNLGVEDGAANLLNHLHKKGYQIVDPAGVKIEPAPESNFSEDYFSLRYWSDVSN